MTKYVIFSTTLILVLIYSSFVLSRSYYVGYSGAPGSSGSCASSCHGASGGMIQITGFPSEYIPDSTYTINISHTYGPQIVNFNGSCRIGTGSQNAGVISAGTNTSVYNVTGETNGVHLSTYNLDSATFNWTAPNTGTDTVKLYIAGLQGGKYGPNTILVLTSTELLSSIPEVGGTIPTEITLSQNYPNPFNIETVIRYSIPQQEYVILEIYNAMGQKTESLVDSFKRSGSYIIQWDASNYSSGVYFYRLTTGDRVITKRMTLLK